MRRFLSFLFAAVIAAGSLMACGPKTPPLEVKIGMDSTYPPFEWVDNTKQEKVGFDVDLINAIAKRSNLKLDLVANNYGSVITGVSTCELDAAISAIVITDELRAQMSFSDPYYTAGLVVVVKKENSEIKSKDDLAGKTVGSQKGSSSEAEAQKIRGAVYKPYQSFDLAINDLSFGYIDAVVADKITAKGYADMASKDIKIVGDEFAPESYGIAVCKDKADLLKIFNDDLAYMKKWGSLNRLVSKWLKNPYIGAMP